MDRGREEHQLLRLSQKKENEKGKEYHKKELGSKRGFELRDGVEIEEDEAQIGKKLIIGE